MAANAPTLDELLALVQTLQAQVTALTAAPPIAAAPPAPTPVVFADTPNVLEVDEVIDYSTKRGSAIYEKGIQALDDKALTDGFAMTQSQTVVFTEALQNKCTQMGWNQGARQITSFVNREGKTIDIIKNYGQIDELTLKMQCENFCKPGEANAQTRAKQNNTMMCACLSKSLTADAKAKLLAHRSDFTFDGVEYAPVMYKVIMRLATMDSVATTQTLRDNLQNLGTFAATVKGDIDKIHAEFDKNYSQLLSRGASVDDPIQILFDAYQVVPCYNFQTYIGRQYDDYLDGRLTIAHHELLLKMAKTKYDWLVSKKKWGAKSPDDEKIVAMAAEIKSLQGKLKLNPKLAEIAKGDDKKGGKKNKKDTSNKREQKKDEAWKKDPPKSGDPKEKKQGELTFHWCEHHMAWTVHKPADCRLGKKHKDEQKPAFRANSATAAAIAATTVNPHYSALLATLGALEEDE